MESDSTHATITTVATRKTLKGIEYIDKGKLVNKMHTVYAVVADLLRKQQETMEKQHQLMERLVSVHFNQIHCFLTHFRNNQRQLQPQVSR